MKKLLTLLLTVFMLFTLVGCDQPTVDSGNNNTDMQEEEQPIIEEEELVGSFVNVEDGTITDELKDIFEDAIKGLLGAKYEPIELVATQVVASTNYKFLAKGSKTTNPPIEGKYYITIYKDLQGNVELKDIEVIEEYSATPLVDATKMSYWVVFYNPDGMELYREAIKYGTIPEYKGETPNYWDSEYWYRFVSWTDKQGNEIKEFKPITGNTYIYAKYEMGGELEDNTPKKDCKVIIHGTYLDKENEEVLYVFPGTTVTVEQIKPSEIESGAIMSLTFTYNGNVVGTYQRQNKEAHGLVEFTMGGNNMIVGVSETINTHTTIYVSFPLDQPP